jgi:hypothetical protein
MKLLKIVVTCAIAATILPGCAPRIRVTQNPRPCDNGIRYYRPKPYLFVSSSGELSTTTDKEGNKTVKTKPNEKYVNIQLQYLPDFAEEYALDVRPGLGVADVSLTLEDGWNLTAVNQKLDSQTDENITAAAELLKGVSGIVSPGIGADSTKRSTPAGAYEMKVRASNVPLGYYESVIGRDCHGRKQLYGFRYIGFLPYQSCPLGMNGMQGAHCESTVLYGLVFQDGVMVFKSLGELDCQPANLERVVADETDEAEVQRSLTYSGDGKLEGIQVQVNDSFSAAREADGTVKVRIPEFEMLE